MHQRQDRGSSCADSPGGTAPAHCEGRHRWRPHVFPPSCLSVGTGGQGDAGFAHLVWAGYSPAGSASTTAPPDLTVDLSTSAAVVAVATPVNFTVTARTTGILSVEDIRFGDGESSGANAGMIACGQTGQPVTINPYTHAYTAPGTYLVTVRVSAIGPAPACANLDVARTATVTVAAPLSTATVGGMFTS